jgi:hypothetical protein
MDITKMKALQATIGLMFFLFCFFNMKAAEPVYPEVGKICPNFTLTNIAYYKKATASLKDFKGKWLILEGWNSYSGQDGFWKKHLLEINVIQRSYSNKVQTILIGYTGSQYAKLRGSTKEDMKMSYEYERDQLKLDLPIAYDSNFFHRFDISACPYIIVIDPQGSVRAICSSLTRKDFASILSNGQPELAKAFRTHEEGSAFYFYNKKNFPQIGKPCPNYMFSNVEDYALTKLSVESMRGKWLVIDCWHKWCVSCIRSFSKIDSFQAILKDKVQFLLIGYNGTMRQKEGSDDSAIRVLYKGIKADKHLSLAHTFDSAFFKQNDISGCPFIILIDPEGIVRAITYDLTYNDLVTFLEGQTPNIPRAFRRHEEESPDFGLDPFLENADR